MFRGKIITENEFGEWIKTRRYKDKFYAFVAENGLSFDDYSSYTEAQWERYLGPMGGAIFNYLHPATEKEGSSRRNSREGLKEPHTRRQERWNELNDILCKNKKFKRNDESVGYCNVKWSAVKPVFQEYLEYYTQDIKEVPQEMLNNLHRVLLNFHRILGDVTTGKEAKRLCFILPILAWVSLLFDGDVMLLVEEDVNGVRVDVNGRFEYVLQRGRKRVCIVEAKKDDLEQGMTQNLLGCEALADIEGLSCVYGISTSYKDWIFFRSLDDKIQREECTLTMKSSLPTKESVAEIAGKLYSMLADE